MHRECIDFTASGILLANHEQAQRLPRLRINECM